MTVEQDLAELTADDLLELANRAKVGIEAFLMALETRPRCLTSIDLNEQLHKTTALVAATSIDVLKALTDAIKEQILAARRQITQAQQTSYKQTYRARWRA